MVGLQWALRMHGFDENPPDGIPPVVDNKARNVRDGHDGTRTGSDKAEKPEEKEADHHPYFRPRDAATLILVDR